MKEIIGGLWLAALCAGVLFGFISGLILFCFGLLFAIYELAKEHQNNQQAESWRKNYPSYKY